ncbi:phospholipase D-like domain-containing protein [Aquabacterium sp. NJ1]|uniref:phospholipase D-like domain-containing protein n=1 Tax=Aquabacterium sp. NJ1 TaxID=1538295 RepID=UPI001F169FA2|nr:phospholipase D-like domain-containing protein [Aquabacterium sp. NJ1]
MSHMITHLHWSLIAVEHGMLVLAGLLVYLTSTRLTRQHRHPSAALAWVLVITLLPYLGIPLYLLFGVRKVPRASGRPRGATARPPGTAAHWALELGEALALPAPARNHAVTFQADGQAALKHLMQLVEQARHSIDICTFVLGHDPVAADLSAALGRASGRGVKVRMLLDDVGSWATPRSMRQALRRNGVDLQLFMPVLRNIRRGRVNLRNHRKLVIVDSQHVWSGGRNLASEYFVTQGATPVWTDISFVVSGPLARQAQDLYQQDWQVASGEIGFVDAAIAAPPAPTSGALLQWIPSGPDHADDTLYALLLAAAYRAEQRILLVSPYFVPDDALLTAWCMACRRGVKLTLVIPARSNHRLADVARSPALRALIAAGADVRLYPRMLHAKAIIVDESVAWCGSANLDSRSLFLNFELNTAFYDANAINWLSGWAQQLADESEPAPRQAPSAARELFEGLVRIVGFQL